MLTFSDSLYCLVTGRPQYVQVTVAGFQKLFVCLAKKQVDIALLNLFVHLLLWLQIIASTLTTVFALMFGLSVLVLPTCLMNS